MKITTRELMARIAELQNVQRRNHPDTAASQDASRKLAPLFAEMAARQQRGEDVRPTDGAV